MKKILLALSLITLPSLASAELAIQDGYSIQGKIFAVKTAKKYSSVEGCTKIALSKSRLQDLHLNQVSKMYSYIKRLEILKAKTGFSFWH